MTREDIIRMAREAEWLSKYDSSTGFSAEVAICFAALVAAYEREKVARWMMERGYATGHGDTIQDLITEVEWQVAELENEACAKLCEDKRATLDEADIFAAFIRARGEK